MGRPILGTMGRVVDDPPAAGRPETEGGALWLPRQGERPHDTAGGAHASARSIAALPISGVARRVKDGEY